MIVGRPAREVERAAPSVVSVGTLPDWVRSISVAQMKPRPVAAPTVAVKNERVTRPSTLKAVENAFEAHAWMLYSLGMVVLNVFATA